MGSTQSLIVGTESAPLNSGFVCPRLKLFEGRDGDDAGEPLQRILKFGLKSHRRLVVSRHTMALDRLEKGVPPFSNAIRVSVVVLQGFVVVHAGLEMVCNNRRTVI